MYFELSGLKQTKDKQKKIHLILEHDSKDAVLSFLKKNNILILSLREFQNLVNGKVQFGETIFGYRDGDNLYKGYAEEKANNAFKFLVKDLNFEIYYLNFRSHPLSIDRANKILNKLKAEHENEIMQSEKTVVERKPTKKQQKIETFREAIAENIKEARELVEMTQDSVPVALIKELQNNVGELLKMRMGQNVEKMIILFEDMLRLMEKVEFTYFANKQKKEENNREDEYVGYLDVVKEYEELKKAKKKKSINAGLADDVGSIYYNFLGNIGIYFKLLVKEIWIRLQQAKTMLYSAFDSVELFCLFFSFLLTFITLIVVGLDAGEQFYFLLIMSGVGGILTQILKLFRTHNLRRLGIIWASYFTSFFFIRRLFIFLLAL